ncbi:MAG: ATP-dependent DNA helicase [Lachnospiraceae bacterium]|nr:ATP-dependent DNA helicase [Lachnospiraceae bacterium]
MKNVVRVSVRNIVEFILRSGDLDNRRNPDADKEAMQKGSRLHRKLQKQMGADYQSEVPLSWEVDTPRYVLRIEGRADGIFPKKDDWYIDEIKGIYRNLAELGEPVAVHEAQAMCYAYFYLVREDLECMGVRMTYGNLTTEEIKSFEHIYQKDELESWFMDLVGRYEKWLDFQHDWRAARNASIHALCFPFEYREGQKKMVAGVYRAIEQGKELFVQAPTGVGKTISSIYPAVRGLENGFIDKIFYLTAKTITRAVAANTMVLLNENGLRCKTLILTAKEKMCPNDDMECNPDVCPYAKGHYDRVNDAVFEMLSKENYFDRDNMLLHAQKWNICPFEMSLDLSIWVDMIICDYNYVFDPNVYLRRFFSEGRKEKYVFLIDEAHNLVERGREMYSAEIQLGWVADTRKKVKGMPVEHKELYRALGRVEQQLKQYQESGADFEQLEHVDSLILACMNLQGSFDSWMEDVKQAVYKDEILDFYFQLRRFLNVAELLDEHYVMYQENFGRKDLNKKDSNKRDFKIKLFCVNPAANIQNCLDRASSSVFFSATLVPINYYQSLFTTQSGVYSFSVPSPFPKNHKLLLVGQDVSSLYQRRGLAEYQKIAEYIQKIVWQKKGNYMVFFPSYQMLESVYEVFCERFQFGSIEVLKQESNMQEAEKEQFLEAFSKQDGPKVGFCIMGGIFGEGIDLIGEQLIGSIVVGTGIPQVSKERELLKKYYDELGTDGFNYAYRYPGMNKVLQAAGRVIRTNSDRGVIALLDGRFMQEEYVTLFPNDWEEVYPCYLENVDIPVREFWLE